MYHFGTLLLNIHHHTLEKNYRDQTVMYFIIIFCMYCILHTTII